MKNIRPDKFKKGGETIVHVRLHLGDVMQELGLVADSLRLGGAILKFYPGMLSAQLMGRLLPEIQHSDNIRFEAISTAIWDLCVYGQ